MASKILHLAHKKELGSQATFRSVTGIPGGIKKIAPATQKGGGVTSDPWVRVTKELLGGIENIAPATQKERRATKELLGGIENIAPATQKERRATKHFSEETKILHLPHKKEVGSRGTSRRHRKYGACHTKGELLGGIENIAPCRTKRK